MSTDASLSGIPCQVARRDAGRVPGRGFNAREPAVWIDLEYGSGEPAVSVWVEAAVLVSG